MSSKDTQLKIMLVSLLLSTVVTCICLYAKPQQAAHAVVQAAQLQTLAALP